MILKFSFLTFNHRKRRDIFKKRVPFFQILNSVFFFFFEPKNWESKVVKIDCCNLPNFFECLFYFLSGMFFSISS